MVPEKKTLEKKTEKKLDNRNSIKAISVFFSALFVCMMVYMCNFVYHNEQEMINNSYNSRSEILLSKNYRGTIYAASGEVLAETELDSAGNETRVYPYSNLFSHSIGYSTNGRMGVEAFCNYYLINSNLNLTEKVSNSTLGLKNPGDSVYTTFDVSIQEAADKALGIYNGAIIMTDVKTGKILAMVSKPNFDPNQIVTLWSDLVEDTESSVLLNRATQGLYPPGSTFKIVTALEYIRQNPDSYSDYSYNCNGIFKKDDCRIQCYHGMTHGKVSFTKSFAKSCNSSFANIGTGLDMNSFADTLEDLLFNQELPYNATLYSKSSVNVSEEMTTDDIMQTSIGQGKTLMTPLHLNMITAAIANNGEMMTPYMVDRVESVDGRVIKTYKPKSNGQVMTEEEARILQELMTAVVESGTASKLQGYGYTAAGKTGSAEYNSNSDSHAWFTGFAPVENPQVAVTVILECAGSGGDYAVPMARRVFDAYFESVN
ncbi:MAG: penicillin-binding protein 2 [Lachnospiraceae bacterium]|nr:penicillin-binding protein 2 [Lachnospiraceae bacterium]